LLKLNEYCNKEFLASTVHTGERIRFGFYGLSIRGNEFVGQKYKPGNRKMIEKYDPETLEVLKTYGSITEAAIDINVSVAAVSMSISRDRILRGFRFRHANTETTE